jgi:S-formylglutathione hydrolase FrmB
MRKSRLTAPFGAALAALGVLSTLTLAPAAPAAAADPPALPNPNTYGITTTDGVLKHPFGEDARIWDAQMTTAAIMVPRGDTTPDNVSIPVKVRFLLPEGYDPNRAQPYDVLYLLHGGADTWDAWSSKGDVVATLAAGDYHFPGIVVMPEAGRSGWYTDWPGHTDGNFAPQWETFHINQLVPWVDANFNTSGTREGRIIAGLSMGGYGALRYAGRHPDLFSAVGAFSAGTDINEPGAKVRLSNSMWQCGACVAWTGLLDGHFRVNDPTPDQTADDPHMQYRLETLFGPTSAWPAQNPYDMVDTYNAYDGKMGVYVGGVDGADAGEVEILGWNDSFHTALTNASDGGVQHRWCRGNGGHNWDSWPSYLTDFIDYVYLGQDGTCPNEP